MKKYGFMILAIVMAVAISGCGKKKEIVASELAEALTNASLFSEQLTELDSVSGEKRYGLNAKDYDELTSYVGTNATCDEFLIVKGGNPDSIISKLRTYIENKRGEYENYRPDEVSKLDAPIFEEYNGTVVMVITADTANALTVYETYLKK